MFPFFIEMGLFISTLMDEAALDSLPTQRFIVSFVYPRENNAALRHFFIVLVPDFIPQGGARGCRVIMSSVAILDSLQKKKVPQNKRNIAPAADKKPMA
jgi:hypothetical protein